MMVTAVMDKLLGQSGTVIYAVGMLVANIVIILVTLYILSTYAHVERQRVAEPKPVATPELGRAPKS